MEEKDVNRSKVATLRMLVGVSCASFALGALIATMGTTIYYLGKGSSNNVLTNASPQVAIAPPQAQAQAQAPAADLQQAQITAHHATSGQQQLQLQPTQSGNSGILTMIDGYNPFASLESSENGLRGGGFFLGDKIIPYMIPLEDNKDVDKAKSITVSKLKDMPSIKVGNGKNPVYIVFDAICPICHQTWGLQLSENWVEKLDLTIHWIPSNYFFQKPESAIASLYILSLLHNNKNDEAFTFFDNMNKMVPSKPMPIPNQAEILDDVVNDLNHGTMAMIQTGQRLPFVIIPSPKSDHISTISGIVEYHEITEALTK